eukprot:5944132-Pleurochrysis_carterae.AAC.1
MEVFLWGHGWPRSTSPTSTCPSSWDLLCTGSPPLCHQFRFLFCGLPWPVHLTISIALSTHRQPLLVRFLSLLSMARSLAAGLLSASPLGPPVSAAGAVCFFVWRGYSAVCSFGPRFLVLDLRLASAAVVSKPATPFLPLGCPTPRCYLKPLRFFARCFNYSPYSTLLGL